MTLDPHPEVRDTALQGTFARSDLLSACAPINDYPRILSDPQVASMGLVHSLELPNGARTRTTGFPIAMSGHDFRIFRPPPVLGADTEDVLDEWL